MSFRLFDGKAAVISVMALFLHGIPSVSQEAPKSFEMTISLPMRQMAVGQELLVDVVTSNPTSHVVDAGEGAGGIALELLDGRGVDIGRHAMGNYKPNQEDLPVISNIRQQALRPGYIRKNTLRWKPDPGYLIPGSYKLRVYRRDMGTGTEVYSNTVTLVVVP
jgi:hypothetical protein